jgi:hypothetical protein
VKPSASHADATGATKRTASISTGAKIFIEPSGRGTTVRIKLNPPPAA